MLKERFPLTKGPANLGHGYDRKTVFFRSGGTRILFIIDKMYIDPNSPSAVILYGETKVSREERSKAVVFFAPNLQKGYIGYY